MGKLLPMDFCLSCSHAVSYLYYEGLFLSTYLLPSLSLSSIYLPSLFLLPVFHLSFTVRLITFCLPSLPPSLPSGSLYLSPAFFSPSIYFFDLCL